MTTSSQVLKELMSLKKAYRTQNFSYTKEQVDRYNELLKLRRGYVNQWRNDERKGGSKS